jgi:hypothetical protein
MESCHSSRAIPWGVTLAHNGLIKTMKVIQGSQEENPTSVAELRHMCLESIYHSPVQPVLKFPQSQPSLSGKWNCSPHPILIVHFIKKAILETLMTVPGQVNKVLISSCFSNYHSNTKSVRPSRA